jgi:uncharacterized membrane protein
VRENIDLVANLEESHLRAQTAGEHAADTIAGFAGTVTFVLLHLVVVIAWTAYNSGRFHVHVFDPFPFSILSLLITLEAVLLTTFVLIKQRRMARQADRRSHLNLQVTLLTERETTKILQMLTRISERLGMDVHELDHEVRELANHTAIDEVAADIHARLPADP